MKKSILRVPPQQWCRIYGSCIEVLNTGKREKVVTTDLAGLSGLKLRIVPPRFSSTTNWIYVEEVNDQ